MSKASEKIVQGRLRSSNITVVISIALILFLLGIFGVILINAKKYSDYLKEQLTVEVFFKSVHDKRDKSKEVDFHKVYIQKIKAHAFTKKIGYISKEKAARIAKNELGIGTEDLFDENIYPASVEVTLRSEFVQPKRVDSIKEILSADELVDEVVNDNELMTSVYQNINKITAWLVAFSGLLLLIVIVLINNSIRLRIFSKRFLIKTMQLVGARRWFIMRPFMVQSMWLGLIGSIISVIALSAVWYYFATYINVPYINNQYFFLIVILILVGVGIALVSTALATWRFLKLKTDELYHD